MRNISDRSELKLKIGGMTCIHCQDTIQTALSQTDGILSADVSYGSGTAEIEYDAEVIGIEEIRKIIEALDYKVLPENQRSDRLKGLYPFLLLAIIIAVYVPLQLFGVLNYLAPTTLADSNTGYGMLFVIGLLTSVHCVAMCGGINLSQCIPKSEEEKPKGLKVFIPALFYNLGRVISYTAIGFILGCIGWGIGGGDAVGISPILQGALKMIAGILMIIMGVNMLGIVPALRKLNITLPKFLRRKIGKKKSSATNPFLVGILNGIMPCGPLQSMWIVALATGNPFSGALSMFLFALGTVPLMLGLGSVVAKLGQKFTKAVMTVGSLLVIVMGLAMLSQGGSLTGEAYLSPTILSVVAISLIFVGVIFSMPLEAKALKILMRGTACILAVTVGCFAFWMDNRNVVDASYDVAVVEGEKQTVKSTLSSGAYPNIAVTKDIPVQWIITADDENINGCNYKFLIAEYQIEYEFHSGENIIEFTPKESGSFSYSCWMGMIYGNIIVSE